MATETTLKIYHKQLYLCGRNKVIQFNNFNGEYY